MKKTTIAILISLFPLYWAIDDANHGRLFWTTLDIFSFIIWISIGLDNRTDDEDDEESS